MSDNLLQTIDEHTYDDHAPVIKHLIELANLSAQDRSEIVAKASALVSRIRNDAAPA